MSSIVAVYPGSFDPVHNGHLDLIERGGRIFEKVVVAVLRNAEKQPLFTVEERMDVLRESTAHVSNCEIQAFSGLLVDFMRSIGGTVIVRGLRAVSDFEYEFQMALMNRRLAPDIETAFMMPREDYSYVSSRVVKEVHALGADVSALVPPAAIRLLRERGKP